MPASGRNAGRKRADQMNVAMIAARALSYRTGLSKNTFFVSRWHSCAIRALASYISSALQFPLRVPPVITV